MFLDTYTPLKIIFLWIWSHSMKKSLMENFILCVKRVYPTVYVKYLNTQILIGDVMLMIFTLN